MVSIAVVLRIESIMTDVLHTVGLGATLLLENVFWIRVRQGCGKGYIQITGWPKVKCRAVEARFLATFFFASRHDTRHGLIAARGVLANIGQRVCVTG